MYISPTTASAVPLSLTGAGPTRQQQDAQSQYSHLAPLPVAPAGTTPDEASMGIYTPPTATSGPVAQPASAGTEPQSVTMDQAAQTRRLAMIVAAAEYAAANMATAAQSHPATSVMV